MRAKTNEVFSFYCNSDICHFSSSKTSFEEANYVVLGVPYDKSSTYRPGSRFAPSYIRNASLNVETYSLIADLDLGDVKIFDIGDLNVVDNCEDMLRRLELVISEIIKAKKIPIIVGGEHTITAGTLQAFKGNFGIIIFDAHLDLREEFMGTKLSHTTFVRRLIEQFGPEKLIFIGTRAVCKEEIEYARKNGLFYITTNEVKKNSSSKILEKTKSRISNFESIYISLDMDVLDPSYAPAVGNPEGFGLSMKNLMEVMTGLCDESLIGFDLVEVSPHYDQGITSIQATKILFEIICLAEKHRIERIKK